MEAWLLEGEELGENRCVFFYYTGHGFQHNWTQAAVNDAQNYKFEIEEKLSALSKIPFACVVVVIDCCREDISHLEKGSGIPPVDNSPSPGSLIILYGCDNSGSETPTAC